MKLFGKELKFNNNKVYHSGNKPTCTDIGAAPISHIHEAKQVIFKDGKTMEDKINYIIDLINKYHPGDTEIPPVVPPAEDKIGKITVNNSFDIKQGDTLEISYTCDIELHQSVVWELRQNDSYLCSSYQNTNTGKIVCHTEKLSENIYPNVTLVAKEYKSGEYKVLAISNKFSLSISSSSNENGSNNNLTVNSSYTIKPAEMLKMKYTTTVNIPSSCAWELKQNGSYLCSAYKDTSTGDVICYTDRLSIGTHNNITLVAKEYQGSGYVDIATSNTFSIIVSSSSGGGSDSGGSGGTTTSGIKVEPASVSIETGKTADVTISFGSDVTNKSMEYMSSNGSVASVSDLGNYKYRITGVGQGKTSIRFRTSDGKFEISCNVTVTASSSGGGGSIGGDTSTSSEYTKSCTSEYILDKMYPMGQRHEAIPNGNITGWKYNSRWENQDRPYAISHSCGQSGCPGTGAFQALGCWSNIYRVEGTPFSQNTGVEMKDIKVYGWYNGAWELVQHLPVPNGNFYAESFSGDANRYFGDSVKQSSTSKTIILREANKINSENCMYHPFSNIKAFDTKYQYIYTCIDLRKVKWDENGVDDRDQTHYCSNCGGDWWLKEGLTFHDSWQHNKGVCQPKMVEITKEWRRFSMTTVPQGWSNGFPK